MTIYNIVCSVCSTPFQSTWKPQKCCSRGCGIKLTSNKTSKHYSNLKQKKIEEYLKDPKKCLQCSKTIPYDKSKSNKFCSQSCSAICANNYRTESGWTLSKESRENLSLKAKQNLTGFCSPNYVKKNNFCSINFCKCKTCDKSILIKYSSTRLKTYCSARCNPNVGGYREKSSWARSGYYKGIYVGSTYELAFLIYCLDHNLKIQKLTNLKFPYTNPQNNKSHYYYPDFLINENTIVEIKGRENLIDKIKAQSVIGYEYLYLNK